MGIKTSDAQGDYFLEDNQTNPKDFWLKFIMRIYAFVLNIFCTSDIRINGPIISKMASEI
ncbi:hypothetical protein JCM12298_15550 [Desulfothermus naphthae]